MSEFDNGMEPEVKKYFRKILNSFGLGFLWMFFISTLGIYFKLGYLSDGVHWYTIVFYLVFLTTFFFLLLFLYRTWKD
jgi:hypothetical protein